MKELNLPHQAPLRFAKHMTSREGDTRTIKVKFDDIPSLAMIVEAAAQSSAAFGDGGSKMGYLVTLKNIKLLEKPTALEYDVKVTSGAQVDALTYFTFETYDKEIFIAKGTFIIALQ